MTEASPAEPTPASGRVAAFLVLGIGGFLTAVTSLSLVGLLRDVTRYGCSYTEEGEGRGWFCGDGIGYIVPGLVILIALAFAGIAAALAVALADRRGAAALSALAAAPLLIVLWASTWGGTQARSAGYEPERYVEVWVVGMLVAAIVLVAAAVLAIVAAFVVNGAPRTARVLIAASAVAGLVAAIAQPGVLGPVIASLSILGAALLRPPLSGR